MTVPDTLDFVPTDALIDELRKRFPHLIVIGRADMDVAGKQVKRERWWQGDEDILVGLLCAVMMEVAMAAIGRETDGEAPEGAEL